MEHSTTKSGTDRFQSWRTCFAKMCGLPKKPRRSRHVAIDFLDLHHERLPIFDEGNGELQFINGSWYVTHTGLIGLARRKRCCRDPC